MNYNECLKKLTDKKEAGKKKIEELREEIKKSESIDEVRSLTKQLEEKNDEMREIDENIADLEGLFKNIDTKNHFNPDQARSIDDTDQPSEKKDKTSTDEYRSAFMDFVINGQQSDVLEKRASGAAGSSALGVLVPQTVIQSVTTNLKGVYGQLYSRVRKTNLPGGVKYPKGEFSATFKRITEDDVSDRQSGGKGITGYVEFGYLLGELRVSRTLLNELLSVQAFENEFSKIIVDAYVKECDKEIIAGDPAKNEFQGILTEAKKASGSVIPATHIIDFTDKEMADWKAWQKKLFAVIPIEMRGMKKEFVMTANTYESNIKTMSDSNNRPVYYETYNPIDGTEVSKFKGSDVVFVENDILSDFDTASAGDFFGMYWVPSEAYAVNENMQFTVRKYFDEDKNQWIQKALIVNDGKIINENMIYLLRKKATA